MKRTILLLLSAFILQLSNAQTITILGSNTFDISTVKDTDIVVVPLTLANVRLIDLKPVTINPRSVKAGNISRESFSNAISLVIDTSRGAVLLIVKVNQLDIQGKFDVYMEFYTDAKKTKVVPLTLSLIKPPASLESLNTVTITKQGCDVKGDPISIRETGSRTGIAGMIVPSPYIDHLHESSLVIIDKPVTIVAGQQLNIPYRIDTNKFKDLPLGPSAGRLWINSPLLTAPLQINFIINNKRSPLWIILTVFLGLVFGLFVRQFLKQQRDLEQSRLNAYQFIQQMVDDAATIADPNYRKAIQTIVGVIEQSLLLKGNYFNPVSGKIDAAVTTGQSSYQTIKTKFLSDLNTSNDTYMEFSQAVYNNQLPDSVKALLAQTKVLLANAKNDLDQKNLQGVQADLKDADTAFNFACTGYIAYMSTFNTFLTGQLFFPTGASAGTKTDITNSNTSISGKVSSFQAPTPSDHLTALTSISEIQLLAEQIPNILRNDLLNDHGVSPATPQFLAALDQYTAMFIAMVENKANQPTASSYWHLEVLAALNTNWGTIAAVVPPLSNAAISVLDLINTPFSSAVLLSLNSPAPDYAVRHVAPKPINIPNAIAKTQRSYLFYSLVQLVLLTFVITLTAYKTYGNDFIGTWPELITLFLVSFSLDITVDSVGQMRTKVT